MYSEQVDGHAKKTGRDNKNHSAEKLVGI